MDSDVHAAELVGLPREQVVRHFFAEWGRSRDAFFRSFDLLAEDCVWDQRPIPRVRGPVGARRFLSLAHRTLGLETIDVDVLGLAVEGDTVHTERVDHLRRADGGLIVSAPVAGVLTFTGGEITYWREYFDSASFAGRVLVTATTHGIRQVVAQARGRVR